MQEKQIHLKINPQAQLVNCNFSEKLATLIAPKETSLKLLILIIARILLQTPKN